MAWETRFPHPLPGVFGLGCFRISNASPLPGHLAGQKGRHMARARLCLAGSDIGAPSMPTTSAELVTMKPGVSQAEKVSMFHPELSWPSRAPPPSARNCNFPRPPRLAPNHRLALPNPSISLSRLAFHVICSCRIGGERQREARATKPGVPMLLAVRHGMAIRRQVAPEELRMRTASAGKWQTIALHPRCHSAPV